MLAFGPGSTLFLYSDALIETPDPLEPVFTVSKLCAFLNARRDELSIPQLPRVVLERLRAETRIKPRDDLTLVALHHCDNRP